MEGAFIYYFTLDYLNQGRELDKEARNSGYKVTFPYWPECIHDDFYHKNSEILSQKRGAGSALWKPYIIRNTMLIAPTVDYIIYMDCGDKIKNPAFKEFVDEEVQKTGYLFVQNTHTNKFHTRRDCFTLMNCDMFSEYPILEAGIVAFTFDMKWFVDEWLSWCQVSEAILDVPNKDLFGKKNYEGFTFHKCDQSILTNLVYKYGLKTIPISKMLDYVIYNERG